MGLGSIGIPSMILILVIALLIFGPKRLPEFGKAAGATLKGFKDSVNDLVSDDEEEEKDKEKEKEKEKTTEEPIKEDHKE